MPVRMETLYCTHCDKSYAVEAEAIRLMQSHGKKVIRVPAGYRYEAGCFFKELALLKRAHPAKRGSGTR